SAVVGVLRAACRARSVGLRGGGDGGALSSIGRPCAGQDPQPPGAKRRARVCVRVRAGARSFAADGQPSPEEADGGGLARARAARQMGLLLAQRPCDRTVGDPCRYPGGVSMSIDAADSLREAVRSRYGVAMTDEMLALARKNAAEAGVSNVHFLKGVIEAIPLPAESVDVVISNCVINLSTNKAAVLTEIARVLKPGGRVGVSDVVAED